MDCEIVVYSLLPHIFVLHYVHICLIHFISPPESCEGLPRISAKLVILFGSSDSLIYHWRYFSFPNRRLYFKMLKLCLLSCMTNIVPHEFEICDSYITCMSNKISIQFQGLQSASVGTRNLRMDTFDLTCIPKDFRIPAHHIALICS